jgi:conjugal transfer pilus assembly protein TraE
MKYLKFKMNWDNTSSVASKSMTVNVVLAIGLICAVFKIAQDHERIVLTPPQLSAKAEIAWNSANDEYMKRWGLFVSSMLGSITPGTASFIRDSLEPLFSAAIWPQISTQIMSVNDDPSYTRTGTINVFTPRNIIWEPGTKKVFVEGNLATTAYRNTTVPLGQFPVTYEMTMEVRYGLPVVTHFTSYLGAPRTLRWRQTHTSEVEALEKKERAGRQNTIIPQDSQLQRQAEDAAEAASSASAAAAGASGASASAAAPKTNATPSTAPTASAPASAAPGENL